MTIPWTCILLTLLWFLPQGKTHFSLAPPHLQYPGGLTPLSAFLAPIFMLHLVLVDHNTTSGCFELASDFFWPYFPSGGFEFCTVVFDISNDLKIEKYQSKHVIVAITNHTDNDHGDLFVRYEGKKQYVSAHVHSVLNVLLLPWHPLIHKCTHQQCNIISMLAKGSHRMMATISFNAICFQLGFAMHLLLAFAELVIIEQLPIHVVFPDMLGQSYKLGHHSDVFLLMPDGHDSLTVTKFSWTHSELCPWGQYLPV
ncbi:hypothetical protein BDR04DRAFT_1119898 [Suillus decipiens]|nr:hypothetical protein BDR04DRAFT_1119898 [Suillus decipiens]